jgi:hypothetical protein
MNKHLVGISAAAALSFGSATSFAQDDFATAGTFAFGVERVFGLYLAQRAEETPTDEDTDDYTQFSFAWGGVPPTVYSIPRVGFDYFVIDGLSLGGSIAYWSLDIESENLDKTDGSVATGGSEQSAFLFSPRVGYAVMFSDVVGIWPRGGITYYSRSFDADGAPPEVDENELAFTAEFHLILAPVEHVGITIGPVIDFGITGEVDDPDPDNPDPDLQNRSFGIAVAGIFGWI